MLSNNIQCHHSFRPHHGSLLARDLYGSFLAPRPCMCPDAPPPRSPSHAKNPPVFVDNTATATRQALVKMTSAWPWVTFGQGGTIKKSSFLDLRPYPFQRFHPSPPVNKPRGCGTRYSPKIMPPRIAECTAEMILWIHLEGGKKLPLTEHPERWNACFLDELVRMGMRELTKIMGGGVLGGCFLQRRTWVFHCSLKELV